LTETTPTHIRRVRVNPWFIVALTAVVVLALVGSAAWVKANEKQVEVSVDGKTITLRTLKKTIADALQAAKVSIGPADEVVPGSQEALSKQQKISVIRAVPFVLAVDGKRNEFLTTKDTVENAVSAAGVALGQLDKVKPGRAERVAPGMTVEIIRVREEVQVTTAQIPFTTQKREDDSLGAGATKVLQEGQNGVKQVKYRTVYEDGKKAASLPVETQVVKQPVPKIVAYGTSGTINRGNQTIRFKKALDVSATAYYPGPESTGRWADGYTYTGMKATYGVVAVDPKVIPLKTRLYIDGYGYAIAADVGSAIKGLKIDLCYDTRAEAIKWGRRKTKVYILD